MVSNACEPGHACAFSARASLSAPPAGLQFAPDREEWEVVFPALWRREPVEAARGSGVSADPGWVRSSRTPTAGSSREVRSVAPAPPEEPAEGLSEPLPLPPPPPEGEEDEEFESQELPRGSGGAAAVSPAAPASWQPPPPPQPPPSPPPALHAEPEGDEVLLRIPAFSRDLYLLLRRDGRFLAPRFEVEQRPSPGQGPTEAAATPGPPAPPDASCFYTGAVLRHPGSLASFSTCGGGLVSALLPHVPVPPPLLRTPSLTRLMSMHLTHFQSARPELHPRPYRHPPGVLSASLLGNVSKAVSGPEGSLGGFIIPSLLLPDAYTFLLNTVGTLAPGFTSFCFPK